MQSFGDDSAPPLQTLERPGGVALAYHRVQAADAAAGPGVMFLTGYLSDMSGSKALHLQQHCQSRGQAFVRFDYRGHGRSGGRFEEATIGAWRDDAIAVLDTLTEGPQILVGSSMGGWIAVLAALARPDRVAGLATIAAAVDMTADMIRPQLDGRDRAALRRDGRLERPSPYGDAPFVVTWTLMEEAERHLLLHGPIGLACPARLLHGMRDPDVPWHQSVRLMERLAAEDVRLVLIKDGGHRLSDPEHLALLTGALDELSAMATPQPASVEQPAAATAATEQQKDQEARHAEDH